MKTKHTIFFFIKMHLWQRSRSEMHTLAVIWSCILSHHPKDIYYDATKLPLHNYKTVIWFLKRRVECQAFSIQQFSPSLQKRNAKSYPLKLSVASMITCRYIRLTWHKAILTFWRKHLACLWSSSDYLRERHLSARKRVSPFMVARA